MTYLGIDGAGRLGSNILDVFSGRDGILGREGALGRLGG